MEKKIFMFLVILFLILLIISCTPPSLEIVEEPAAENIPVQPVEEQTLPEESPEMDVPKELEEKLTKPAEQAFQLIYPKLTYDGAYNGPLYGTSEQIGSITMDKFFKLLDKNGINFFIGMFPIKGEPQADTLVSHSGLGHVIDAVQKYPRRIIPLFNPGIGGEEIEKKGYLQTSLFGWYKNTLTASKKIVGDDFIRGFGEVETQEWNVRHNDPKVMGLIELAKKNNINFMFHPVASKFDDVEKIIEAYPSTNFIIHMFREDLEKSRSKLIEVLKNHDNIYFSMDAAHILHIKGDIIYDFDSTNKQTSVNKFVAYYNSNEKTMVDNAVKAYKPLVDAVPDKVMWGTEIGPEYAFDPQVFDRAVKASRLVIGRFDKEHQEAVGYENALRGFGEGVILSKDITVINTNSWSECNDDQISTCDDECETEDDNPASLRCFDLCTIKLKCREVPEQDVG